MSRGDQSSASEDGTVGVRREAAFEVAPVLLDVVRRLQLATPASFPDELRHAIATGARLIGAERTSLRIIDPQAERIIERYACKVVG